MVWIWAEHEAYLGDNLGMTQSGTGCLGQHMSAVT